MWRDLEEEAIYIGLDLNYFWTLTPKQWKKYVKVFNKKREEELKEKDSFNYVLGKYIAYAFNDPKHYPSKPFSEIKEPPKIMTADEMERKARINTAMLGGVVKK